MKPMIMPVTIFMRFCQLIIIKYSFRTSNSPYDLDVYEEESDQVKKVLQEHVTSALKVQ